LFDDLNRHKTVGLTRTPNFNPTPNSELDSEPSNPELRTPICRTPNPNPEPDSELSNSELRTPV